MTVKHLASVGMAFVAVLSGCTSERMEAVWPEPCPLGRGIPAYRAAAGPPPPSPLTVDEPEGP